MIFHETNHLFWGTPIYIYIYISLWIQTVSEKVLNPPNHIPNTS